MLDKINESICPICLEAKTLKVLRCGCAPCLQDLHSYCVRALDNKQIDFNECPGNCGEFYSNSELKNILQ